MAEGAALLETVRAAQGQHEELGGGGQWKFLSPLVMTSEEQTDAVLHIFKSRDLVTSIRSPTGPGKTSVMQEAVKALAVLSGKDVLVVPNLGRVTLRSTRGFGAKNAWENELRAAARRKIAPKNPQPCNSR